MNIGILGGGQLGRMLALAAYRLGFEVHFLDPSSDAPAGKVAPQVVGAYDDPGALRDFGTGLDVVTYEFENIPPSTLHTLSHRLRVLPTVEALEVAQDRAKQRAVFERLGLPSPSSALVDTRWDLERASELIGLPAVLKTRHAGYDGKGQIVLQRSQDLEPAWRVLGGQHLILEQFVRFERELSVIAVRGVAGHTCFYPLIENEHREGILRTSCAPIVAPGLQEQAEQYARRLLDELRYTGVLTLELFQVGDRLLINEMATRVHNSGHWTIDGAVTSQFENHLRAITGLPLGSTEPTGWSGMINLLDDVPPLATLLAIDAARVHLYGKDPRPGRKLGHVVVTASSPELRDRYVHLVRRVTDGYQSSNSVPLSAQRPESRPSNHLYPEVARNE